MFDNIDKLIKDGVTVNIGIEKKALLSLALIIFVAILFSQILNKKL